MVMRMRASCVADQGRIFGISTTVGMAMACLAAKAGATATAHESIPPKVRHFKSCHLSCYLPELTCEQDNRPGQLESCPHCNGNEGRVICCDGTQLGG